MFCPNCGKELPDGAKFCSGCGRPVDRPQEQPAPFPVPAPPVEDIPEAVFAPAGAEPCESTAPITGETPVGVIPESIFAPPGPAAGEVPAVQTPVPPVSPPVPPAAPGGGKRRGRGLVILGIAAAVLAVIAAAVAALASLLGGGSAPGYVYLTDDNELMFLKDLKEKTPAVEFSDEATSFSRVVFSKDGGW